ncbi:MAG: hypothetical protein ACYS9X_08315 [Planctomycetota bacterium]|jgi:hypothetical protein
MAGYSCKRCGEEISDADFASGRLARDKTGGLYCMTCAKANAAGEPAAVAARAPGRRREEAGVRGRRSRAVPAGGGAGKVFLLALLAAAGVAAGAYFVLTGGKAPAARPTAGGERAPPRDGSADATEAGGPGPRGTATEPGRAPATDALAGTPAETPVETYTAPEPVAGREAAAAGKNIAAYVGKSGSARFEGVIALSDGTLLVTGSAKDLDWLPAGVERSELAVEGLENEPADGPRIGFMLQMSSDLSRFIRIVTLPAGAAEDLKRVRTTNVPGRKTGDMYVSGTLSHGDKKKRGYFVARLDGNFVDRVPTRAAWTRTVWADGDMRKMHPWDVASDGKVYYASGAPFSYDWCSLSRLKADGTEDAVEHWRVHWGIDEAGGKSEEHFAPLSSRPGFRATHSSIVLKMWGRPCLRSMTRADYDAWLPDGNGGRKKGRWPVDYWFAGPYSRDKEKSGPGGGYTGYKPGSTPSGRVACVIVDRRNDDMYFGFNFKSRLPGGNPDFEPGVVAMTRDGALKWWSRLYHEFLDKNGNKRLDPGEPTTSTPDQYVDYMALDYATNALVVQARCHGNNVINFWSGNAVAARPGAETFHNGFTGSGGNFHIRWLGKLELGGGELRACCYLAAYAAGKQNFSKPYADPNLDGWPSHNSGWPRLNTTGCNGLEVDSKGRVYIVGTGRWPVTTRNAFQKMYRPDEGKSKWADFVRVYTPNFETVVYSSILTGAWAPETEGTGASSVSLKGVLPVEDGAIVVGGGGFAFSKAGEVKGTRPMPTANVPAWGAAVPRKGEAPVVANLRF